MLNVRPAQHSDIPALANLWLEKMVLVAQSDARIKVSSDATAQWSSSAAQWLSDARCMIYAAEQEDSVTGFAIGWLEDAPPGIMPQRIGIVTELALDMHQYQQGSARALITALRDWFNTQDIKAVAALVPHRHPVEQAFWRAMGATEWVDLMWIK